MTRNYAKWILIAALFVFLPCAQVSAESDGEKNKQSSRFQRATKKSASSTKAKSSFTKQTKYPKTVKTRAGTLVINNPSQEVGEIIRVDTKQGYVAYTNPSGILLKRFTQEAIERARKAYGDHIAELMESANDGTGQRIFSRGLKFEADLARYGVDPEDARKIVRDYLKNPKSRNERKAREKAIIDAFNLPKELAGRGYNEKDLAGLIPPQILRHPVIF